MRLGLRRYLVFAVAASRIGDDPCGLPALHVLSHRHQIVDQCLSASRMAAWPGRLSTGCASIWEWCDR